MQLPHDLKQYGRRIDDAEDFWAALIGVIAASVFIGYVIGFLAR